MTLTDMTPPPISGENQRLYQRLKNALSITLRRQILLAVCDDLCLRNSLAARLERELSEIFSLHTIAPQFISLHLNLSRPQPFVQIIEDWTKAPEKILGFQILGIEHLTRQPGFIQWSFLTHLREIESNLPSLNCNILLWVTHPWLCSIQQSAPEFWRWGTEVFEFEGEPTPVPQISDLSHPEKEIYPLNNEQVIIAEEIVLSRLNTIASAPGILPPLTWTELRDLVLLTAPDSENDKNLPLEILSLIEFWQQQKILPQMLGNAYQNLGDYYRDRVLRGDISLPPLLIAIHSYQQILVFLHEEGKGKKQEGRRLESGLESYPWDVVDILNDLGTLYRILFRYGKSDTLAYLEHSIELYQEALNKIEPETQPQRAVKLHQNLGISYSELSRYQNPLENWQRAILAYQETLLYLNREQDRTQYAVTQNNLGTAYWHLAQYQQPIPHLKSAIQAYRTALTYYPPQQDPFNYAGVQTNLGTAYWNLAQHQSDSDLLIKAIEAYQEALKYHSREQRPAAVAATQNNLGTAYWHLAQHTTQPQGKREALQNAIVTYETTLQIIESLPPSQLTFDPRATHNNLGLGYYQLATEPELRDNHSHPITYLHRALKHQVKACVGFLSPTNSGDTSDTPPGERNQTPYKNTLNAIVKTLRAFYTEGGLAAQNLALSQIPGDLLPEIWRIL
ncbi:MAG: tetratricopeptide repeat protein [Microcoleaceae cyanobacterium]